MNNLLVVEFHEATKAEGFLALLRELHRQGGVELTKYAIIRTNARQQPDISIREVMPPYLKALMLAGLLGVMSGLNLAIFAEAIPFIGQALHGNIIEWAGSQGLDQGLVVIALAILAGTSTSMLGVGRNYIGDILGKVVTRVTHQKRPLRPEDILGQATACRSRRFSSSYPVFALHHDQESHY